MLTEICADIRNYFCNDDADKHFGKFTISGGSIAPLDFLQEGQYFRILDSAFNDGVYQYPASNLTDEVFEGAVWAMKVPPAFLALAADIKKYDENNQPGAFTSESFAGYSYTRATGANGAPLSWHEAFAPRLNKWRSLQK